MFHNRWRLISFALLGVIGIMAGAVFAMSHGDAEVRINTFRHDDGRVEVGLQQRGDDGEWGERSLPQYRFLPPDAVGEWRNSSPISVVTEHAHDDDAMSDDVMSEPEAMSDPPAPEPIAEPVESPLYCVVHHGHDDDLFWLTFDRYLVATANDVGLTNLEIHSEPDVADQAAAISDCVDRGALGIASTLPSIDMLEGPLSEARSSGAFVLTFNSGAEFASRVGSAVHLGLDDRAAGERAGERFNAADAASPVLCIVHETANRGLDDRCDGLEATYEGEVERVNLTEGILGDADASEGEISAAIAEHQAGAVLVLNAGLIRPGIAAVGDGDALVGSIGRLLDAPQLIADGDLLFQIDDGDVTQGAQVVQSFVMIDQSPFTRGLLSLTVGANPVNVNTTSVLLLVPSVIDKAYFDGVVPGWEDIIRCVTDATTSGTDPSPCFESGG